MGSGVTMDKMTIQIETTMTTPAFVFQDGQITTDPWIKCQQDFPFFNEIMHFTGTSEALVKAGIMRPEMQLQGRQRRRSDGDRWTLVYAGGGRVRFTCW